MFLSLALLALPATTVSFFSGEATICTTQRKWLIFMAGFGYLYTATCFVRACIADRTPRFPPGRTHLLYIKPIYCSSVKSECIPRPEGPLTSRPSAITRHNTHSRKHRYYLERNLVTSTEYILSTSGALTREFFTTLGNVRTWELPR